MGRSVLSDAREAKSRGDADYLTAGLIDTNPLVRRYSARALGDLRATSAVQPLLRCATQSGDEVLQAIALRALELIGDATVVPALYEFACEERPFGVKTSAMRALCSLGDRRAIELLARLMVDPDLVDHFASVPSSRPSISAGSAKKWISDQLVVFRGIEAIPLLESSLSVVSFGDRRRIRGLLRRLKTITSDNELCTGVEDSP